MVNKGYGHRQHKRSSFGFFVLVVIFLTGLLFAAVWYWYRSQPEQKIIRRFSALLQQIEKKSVESDLINMATAKGVVNFCTDPVTLSWQQHSGTLGKAELLQAVSRVRKSVDSIALIPDQANVIFPDPSDPELAELSVTITLKGDYQDLLSGSAVYAVDCLYRKDPGGDYLLESVQVNPLLSH